MSNKRVSICDECGCEAPYHQSYSRPTDWIGCTFASNDRSVSSLDFCSRECIKKYITSESIGNDIGHNIKEFAKKGDDGE